MRVAIIGLAPSTHDAAPWGDKDWEIWGLPWDIGYWPRMHRFFEMHDRSLLEMPEACRPKDYWKNLAEIDWGPVYMHRAWPDIPASVPFPIEEVARTTFAGFPRAKVGQADWYNSSPAYMLALAIHEGAETIGLWGVDVRDYSEFAYERPCLEYLIGLAVGKGIEVIVPDGPSALCRFQGEGINLGKMMPSYRQRYGFI